MVNLYQYFNQNDWDNFVTLLKKNDLDKHIEIYTKLVELNYFPNDINIVIASLFDYMFFSKKEILEKWLNKKIDMLDNKTPIEASESKNGVTSLKVYLPHRPL